jgi:hypothetical protein
VIRTTKLKVAFWAAAVGVGAYLGYLIADSLTMTSGLAILGTLFIGAVIMAILFVLGVVAAAVGLQPDRRGRPAARAVIVSGVLLVVGVAVGWALTPVLGLGYHPAIESESLGTMSLSLDGLDGFESDGDAAAFCRSAPDSDAVAYVTANALGSVATGTVTASLIMNPLDSPDGRPTFGIGVTPAVKGENAAPNWHGSGDLEPIEGDRGGRITFTGAALVAGETGRPPLGWPAELSGVLSWSCDAWSLPGESALP